MKRPSMIRTSSWGGLEHMSLSFDDIVFGEEIGQGGFADVYAATYKDKPAAVKNVRVEAVGTRMLAELRAEIKSLSSIRDQASQHYLLHLFGVVTFPSTYIVTEMCERGE